MHTLGYIHARERLWQMVFLRRVGEGRLSEIVGQATVDTDVFLRTLDQKDLALKKLMILFLTAPEIIHPHYLICVIYMDLAKTEN